MSSQSPAPATSPAARILVIDDEPDLRTLYELTLLRQGYRVESAADLLQAREHLKAQRFDAVITDMRLPDGLGLELLRDLAAGNRPERCVVITAHGSAENAVDALKAGAFDYLTKPVDLKQFRSVVASAIQETQNAGLAGLKGDARSAPSGAAAAMPKPADAAAALLKLVGASPLMQAVKSRIVKVAGSMAPILIRGESGTGKELVARAIHDAGVRSAQPFIAVNCGAIPEQLLEAEFFGYRKGAFTGANEDRDGFFQAARGGTLFLDEIGDLPLSMQSKLLRSIQERSVRPVGATHEMPLDVRIVSATHKNLAADVQAGRFRQDLYYRLNVIQIRVPALRERLEDLPAICERVLERITADAGVSPPPRLTREALAYLLRYPFGGNVRELENLLHRAVALCEGDVIDVQTLDLPESAFADNGRTEAASLPADPPPPRGESAALVAAPPAVPAALPDDLAAYLDAVERDILVRALEHYRFNRTAAGASMGLSLRQMRYRMARLGVMAAEHGVALESGGSEGPDVAP